MSEVVIDTNVMVVANRQNAKVAQSCADACVAFLIRARAADVVLLDNGDEIRGEYARALQQGRPYQLGMQFLIHIYQQLGNLRHVRMVELARDGDGGFADFPRDAALAAFDRSDRKFAALARATGAAVTNATDSDWLEFLPALNGCGIEVNFLCGQDAARRPSSRMLG